MYAVLSGVSVESRPVSFCHWLGVFLRPCVTFTYDDDGGEVKALQSKLFLHKFFGGF